MKKYGVIGYPLGHSISPEIHNRAFKALKIDALYEKVEIKPEQFDEKISALKKNGVFSGFNVTIPFKENIITYLDEIEPISAKIGAINTVKIENGKWYGFNTDYLGFIRPLKNRLSTIKSALILGAGGAAKGVIYGLLEKGDLRDLYIANRTRRRAEELAASIETALNTEIRIISPEEVNQLQNSIDLLVNTTNVGMGEQKDQMPVELSNKFSNTLVYDLIYNPKKTKLLARSESMGCGIINGLPMLIYQADESFKIWTNKRFPNEVIDHFLK